MACHMIENYVFKINEDGAVPNITSAWMSIVENECIHGNILIFTK